MKEVSLSALFRKKSADLSGGYYTRSSTVRKENRSQYNELSATETASLGMGIVQAVLAVLSLHVESFTWGEQGRIGQATLYSTSKRPKSSYTYEFSWDERDPAFPMYGGLANGLTYQLVMLHLITSFLDARYRASEGRMEVFRCWNALVSALGAAYERDNEGGWSEDKIGRACFNQDIQPHIERVSDALWFSMRYQLPEKNMGRTVLLSEVPVLGSRDVLLLDLSFPGRFLLAPEQENPLPLSPPTRASRQNRLSGELLFDEQPLSRFRGERGKRLEVNPESWELPGEEEFF